MSHPVDVLPLFYPHTSSRLNKGHDTEGKGSVMKLKKRAIGLLTTMAVVLVIGSGVALAATAINCTAGSSCLGTPNLDTINGSSGDDEVYGLAGADTMHGYGGSDSMQGDKGSEHIYGGSGADSSLWGGAYDPNYTDKSDDYVYGGGGDDTIYGGYAQSGVDRIYGGAGNDFISASQRNNPHPDVPETKEIIDCGAGASDEVYFDKGLDVVKNCEIEHGFS
jgi:Ca2+-binding RTX toxin-like protein